MKKIIYLLLISGLILTIISCVKKKEVLEEVKEEVSLEGKNIVMIIASSKFRDEEYQQPRQILESQGAKVTVASSKLKESIGMLGLKVKPDILIEDINVADYDAIIFVGGQGASEYWFDATCHKICRVAVKMNKVLAAICIAPVTLANAGVLTGKKATAFFSEIGKLKDKGVEYTGKDVEIDGNIITASGPDAAAKFANAIVKALK